ncbi:PrsW family intramembrane metalloprotease [Propionibacteriaceae bacterium Y1923]|uniref:PrsW family intramembrane metalloprotease n=1 Tax=Aestuariimicrobium sp. Y1814 TaxID=3418742 RepID=UPI003C248C00
MATTVKLERRARVLNGIPRKPDLSKPPAIRLLKNPWIWGTIILALVSFIGLWDMYAMLHPDVVTEEGIIPGIQNQSFILAAKYAWPTAAIYVALFVLLDRFRRQNIWMYLMAFLWGGVMSTWFSIYVNTWMGQMLGVTGNDPTTSSRSAIFSAPFVEEAAKCTFLFALAILARYRIVSTLQAVSLAGINAIGFAFVENIVYYSRAHNYATLTPQIADPEAAMAQLVLLRGVYTSFGHPLFTCLAAFGIVVGLRHRAKIVRICAPLAGFAFAALGHMAFNGIASITTDEQARMYWFIGLGLVAMIIITLIGHAITEGRRIRARLTDFVRMGWLADSDPFMYSRTRSRVAMITIALFQPRRLPATLKVMRHMTELAYLRDGMTRGLIDEAGYERSRDLIQEIEALRPVAVTSSAHGERIIWPKFSLPKRLRAALPARVPARSSAPNPQWAPPS